MRNIRLYAKRLAPLGIFIFCHVSPASAEQCQLKLIASLDMIENPYGELLMPIGIAGTSQTMLLDTAGASGSLTVEVADVLKLKHKDMSAAVSVYGSLGEKYDRYVTVPSVNIGPVIAQNVNFLLIHKMGMAAGTIGPDVLRSFDIDLDFGKKKVNFFSPDHCKGQVVYWTGSYVAMPMKISESGHIEITASLDNHDLQTTFDTGTTHSTLSLPIARSLFDVDEKSANVTQVRNTDANPIYRTNFKSLSLQGISVPNPTVDLIPDAMYVRANQEVPDRERYLPGLPHVPDLILGMDVIHQLHVYIAYQEHMLYLTAADAH
jgi:predicted aspartyl protease